MKSLKKLLPYLKPHRVTIICSLAMSVLVGAASIVPAKLVQIVIDDVLVAKNKKMLVVTQGALVGLYLVMGILRFIQMYLLRYTGDVIATELRNDLQKKYSSLSLSFHSENAAGGLISKVFADVTNVQVGLTMLADVIREPINALALAGFVFYTNWRLAILILVLAPVLIITSKSLGRSVRKYSKLMLEATELFTGVIKETIDGIRIIKAFTLEEHMSRKFKSVAKLYLFTRRKILSREEFTGPLVEFLSALSLAAILWFAYYQVLRGQTTPGGFLAFVTALGMLQNPIKKLQDAHVRLQHAIASTDRVFEILETPTTVQDPQAYGRNPKAWPENWGSIEFEKVHFSFGDNHVLKGVDLSIKRGEVIAIVGASGSGKTTLVNMLLRFYDPTQGNIKIGDVDVKDLTLKDLRSHAGLVTQDVFLFNESVRDNVSAGQQVDESAVSKSLEAAYAADFVGELPLGYNTIVGDRGSKLSGGERQRISIARAIYKNAPILILDEATSALDSESEEIVQQALEALMQDRTTLVIAHRLSTIQKADRIVVLSDGKIIEQGTHSELVRSAGAYQKLYEIQFKQPLSAN